MKRTPTVVTYKSPLLREVCPKATTGDPWMHIVTELKRAMEHYNAVGFAAPQIGYKTRIIVTSNPNWPVLINPEIVEAEGEQVGREGCVSIPGYIGTVERSKQIKVTATNEHFDPIEIVAEDLDATILQHEIDHLDGILISDKAINSWYEMPRKTSG